MPKQNKQTTQKQNQFEARRKHTYEHFKKTVSIEVTRSWRYSFEAPGVGTWFHAWSPKDENCISGGQVTYFQHVEFEAYLKEILSYSS